MVKGGAYAEHADLIVSTPRQSMTGWPVRSMSVGSS
jgi:hypothetical protein